MLWVPAAEEWEAGVQPLCTLQFASPELLPLLMCWPPTAEQLATAAQHLRASNVWGLGAVLYCAVTREAPFGPSEKGCALQSTLDDISRDWVRQHICLDSQLRCSCNEGLYLKSLSQQSCLRC